MLKSLRNHVILTRRNDGQIVAGGPGQVADAEKKNRSFTVIKSIAIEFVPVKQVGMGVNTIIGDGMASRNSQNIELSRVAMIRLGSQIGWAVLRECNTVHARSQMSSGL